MAGAISCAATPPLRLWIRLNAAGRTSTIQLGSEKRSEKSSLADQTFQNDFSSKISLYKTPLQMQPRSAFVSDSRRLTFGMIGVPSAMKPKGLKRRMEAAAAAVTFAC